MLVSDGPKGLRFQLKQQENYGVGGSYRFKSLIETHSRFEKCCHRQVSLAYLGDPNGDDECIPAGPHERSG